MIDKRRGSAKFDKSGFHFWGSGAGALDNQSGISSPGGAQSRELLASRGLDEQLSCALCPLFVMLLRWRSTGGQLATAS